MNCQEFDARLPRYVYHERIPEGMPIRLSVAEVAAMDEHVRSCASCGAVARPLRTRLCREVIDTLVEYIEGTMAPDDRAIFDLHLRVCPACVAYLDSYRQTLEAEKAVVRRPVDESIPEDLVRAVLAARRKLDR